MLITLCKNKNTLRQLVCIALISFKLMFILSCSNSGTSGETAVDETSKTAIFKFLKDGSYTDWTGYSQVKVPLSGSPHGKVKIFINETLEKSMADFTTEHTLGSIAVKELYANDAVTLEGYAYSRKVKSGTEESSWLWYEDADLSTAEVDFYGSELTTCLSCHAIGAKDYVRIGLDAFE